jgi:hypothetical protein
MFSSLSLKLSYESADPLNGLSASVFGNITTREAASMPVVVVLHDLLLSNERFYD